MSKEVMEALAQFKVVDIPQEAQFGTKSNAKLNVLGLALQNLSGDKSIYFTKEEWAEISRVTDMNQIRYIINTKAKKLGYKAGVVEKNGGYFFFNK